MESSYKFTIFTPIYNRKDKIKRVWDSIVSQTFRDFEWIVIDDGSSDGVMDLLETWRSEASFPMTVIRQENMGKHVAWNVAVAQAKGELFVPADSDDAFDPDTLERFAYYWDEYLSDENRREFSGINVLCKDPDSGEIIGNKYPNDKLISNNLELHYVHSVVGEKWGCIRIDLLKSRPFKKVNGSYLSENWIWFYLARSYHVLCVNEALRSYYTDAANALSSPDSASLLKSAESKYTYLVWHVSANFDYICRYGFPVEFLKNFLNIWRFGEISGMRKMDIIKEFDSIMIRSLLILFYIPSVLLFFRASKKLRNIHN